MPLPILPQLLHAVEAGPRVRKHPAAAGRGARSQAPREGVEGVRVAAGHGS